MKLFYPEIFEKFVCTGSECSDNCCETDWDVEIDDDTFDFYKKLDSDIGRKFVGCVTEDEGCKYLVHKDGKCPMLNEKGLCSVQLAYGAERISDICREHPRFYEWFGNYKEAGVGLSCEEAVRMYLSDPEPVKFHSKDIDEEADDLEFDETALIAMLKARTNMIALLQDRALPIKDRLTIALNAADCIQFALDSGDLTDIDKMVNGYKTDSTLLRRINEENSDLPDPIKTACDLLEYLLHLDYIDAFIPQRLRSAREYLLGCGNMPKFEHSGEVEKLAVYFVYRYFLKAVRDLDLLSKFTAMAVIIFAFAAISISQNSDTADRFLTLKELCKEIEYSQDNMDRIYDDSYMDDRLSLSAVFSLLEIF